MAAKPLRMTASKPLTQLSHQTKKYDLKSKHCQAPTDLGTTRAKVVEALTEVRRAKIDGPALIFDDQLSNCIPRTPTPAHQRRAGQCQMSSERAVIFSTTNRHWPRNPAVFWGIPGVGCVTVGKLGLTWRRVFRHKIITDETRDETQQPTQVHPVWETYQAKARWSPRVILLCELPTARLRETQMDPLR